MSEPGALRWRHDAALLTVVVIWGVNFPLMKDAVSWLDPLVFHALRFTLSVALLGVLGWRERVRLEVPGPPLSRSNLVRLIISGLLGHLAYQVFFILGLERTTSGTSALLVATAPLWTAVFGHASRVEALRPAALAGVVIGFLGAVQLVVTGPAPLDGSSSVVGNTLTLGAALGWAVYTVLNRPLLKAASPTWLAFTSMLVALVPLWLVALPRWDAAQLSAAPARVWWVLVYSGLFSSGVAYVLWNVGIRGVGPSQTAVYTYLVPVLALIGGWALLGEPIGIGQLLAGAAIVWGMALMRRARDAEGSAPGQVREQA